MQKRRLLLLGMLVLVLAGVGIANLRRGTRAPRAGEPAAGRGGAVGVVTGGNTAALSVYGEVPDFELVSQTGDTVRLADLRGRVWIGDFIFTHCASTCPMMSAQLQKLEKALGDEANVRLVSFSVDPERDTPERLAEYARGYGAKPDRWVFLTGDKSIVRHLAMDGFKVTVADASPEDIEAGADPIMHSTRLALVDGRGRIRGYYDGTDETAVQQLGKDVHRLVSGEAP